MRIPASPVVKHTQRIPGTTHQAKIIAAQATPNAMGIVFYFMAVGNWASGVLQAPLNS